MLCPSGSSSARRARCFIECSLLGSGTRHCVLLPSRGPRLPGSRLRGRFKRLHRIFCLSLPCLNSLAARWAAKEAFIKAWSSLYYGREDPLKSSDIDWAEIEVVCDRWGRPAFRFHGRIASELDKTQEELKASLSWLLSLSHDGNYAIAWVSVNQTDLREAKEFS